MNALLPKAAANAVSSAPLSADPAAAIHAAALLLLPHLERGQRVDATFLRAATEASFGASERYPVQRIGEKEKA